MHFQSVQLNNGNVFDGEKIGELVSEIINKFSEAGLSCDEAKIVLDEAKGILGEFSADQKSPQRVFGRAKRERSVGKMEKEIVHLQKQVKELRIALLVTQVTTIVMTVIFGYQCLRSIWNYQYLLQQVSMCLESVNTVYAALRQFLAVL